MAKKKEPQKPERAGFETISSGFGNAFAVTPCGKHDVIMWFQDALGTIRGVRVECDTSRGLNLRVDGQARIMRT